jgi:hypothetical protein
MGDLIIQAHDMSLPPEAPVGPYTVRLGMYDPQTNTRLPAGSLTGGDYVEVTLE